MVDTSIQIDGVKASQIPGYSGYFITVDGRVWSERECRGSRGRFLSPNVNTTGYLYVVINKYVGAAQETFTIHRLLAMTFMGKRTSPYVRHLNGDRLDNRLDNLAYGTARDNLEDDVRLGKTVNASRGYNTKLTPREVRKMRALRLAGWSLIDLADKFKVDRTNVWAICTGKTWKEKEYFNA